MDGGRVSTLVVLQAPGEAPWLGAAVRETARASAAIRIAITREGRLAAAFFLRRAVRSLVAPQRERCVATLLRLQLGRDVQVTEPSLGTPDLN